MTRFYLLALLSLTCLMFSTSCIQQLEMNKNVLSRLKAIDDYEHHFIFFSQEVFNSVATDLEVFSSLKDVKFYSNDCESNKMYECDGEGATPILLLFNKVFIRYNADKDSSAQIIDWMESRIMKSPTIVSSLSQIQTLISRNPETFCYCNDPKAPLDKSAFYSLSKAVVFPYCASNIEYCFIDDQGTIEELNLTNGNLTLFKSSDPYDRVEFKYKNSYNMWESFLKMNTLSHLQRSNHVLMKRFEQADKNEDSFLVICDFSFRCEQFWKEFNVWSRQFKTQNPNITLRADFYDRKMYMMFVIYLNTVLNQTQFPALINFKIFSNNGKAGYYRSFLRYLQQLNSQAIDEFRKDIEEQKIQPEYRCGETPKKNGFYGKNSEKLIQKLITSNVNQTIEDAQTHYVLLLTALNLGCNECDVYFTFYKDYKKAASLLSDHDLTFGVLDLSKNQVEIDEVQSLPEVLLYNKYHKDDPVRMRTRHNFDSLFQFLEVNSLFTAGEL